jgi:hypothetical protein
MPTNDNSENMVGWVYFAGVIMILQGVSQAFLGITALVNKQYLLAHNGANQLVLSTANIKAWGWVDLAVGVLVLAAGYSLLHGSNWAKMFALVFVGASFLVNMAFLGVFPLWAVIAMIVDALIIYALVVQGKKA